MPILDERILSTKTSEEKEKKEDLKRIDEKTRQLRDLAKKCREKAVESSGFDFQHLPPDIEEKMNQLPNSLSEIIEAINLLKLKCEGIRNVDETILEDYQKYQREIQEKHALSLELEQRLSQREQEIQELQPVWLGSLRSLIDRINQNFSEFMGYLKFRGEVYLFAANEVIFNSFFASFSILIVINVVPV